MKWLAVAAAVVAAALLVLWYEVRSSGTPAASASTDAPVAPAPKVERKSANLDAPMTATALSDDEALPPGVRPFGTKAPEDETGPIKKFSEPFWERVDEVYSRKLLGYAADCYEGGKDRKQKLKVSFKYDIVAGKVSVRDVRMVESTLGDAALEACMVKAIAGASFEDKNMPDWSSAPEDEETLLVRISTLKRFGPQTD